MEEQIFYSIQSEVTGGFDEAGSSGLTEARSSMSIRTETSGTGLDRSFWHCETGGFGFLMSELLALRNRRIWLLDAEALNIAKLEILAFSCWSFWLQ